MRSVITVAGIDLTGITFHEVISSKYYSREPRWYGVPVGWPLRAFTRRFRLSLVQAMVTAIRGLANEFAV